MGKGANSDRSVVAADVDAFTDFVGEVEPRLRIALMAALGPERGREATAEALAYGWENWKRVQGLEFPVAYLFRVGRSRTRSRKLPFIAPPDYHTESSAVEPGLDEALGSLSHRQRLAVVLVHAFEWTHAEAAQLMGVKEPTVKTHVQRGLAKLRRSLGVTLDA